MQKMILLASNIPAAIVGGGMFLLALFGFHLTIPLAIGVSVAAYLVAGLLIFPAKPAIERQRKEMLTTVIKEGRQSVSRIKAHGKKIQQPRLQKQIGNMCDVAEQIFETMKKNPQNVRSAQQFSAYYLDATEKIIQKYLALSEHKAYSTDVKQSLAKVETVLNDLHATFEKQLSQLLRDDVFDLDTELSVLKETIEIENL